MLRARQVASFGNGAQERSNAPDRLNGIAAVRLDVLSRDIGKSLLVTIRRRVENQAPLLFLGCLTETFGPKKHAQLERHVESRQIGLRIQAHVRQIVNSKLGFLDQSLDLLQPGLTSVDQFERASRDKPAVDNRK